MTGSEDIGAHRGETMASKRKRTIAMPVPYLRRFADAAIAGQSAGGSMTKLFLFDILRSRERHDV
jgi:hypothetical protein